MGLIANCCNCDEAEEQLETTITQSLERKIRRKMTGDEPFDVQHEVYEWESRQSAQAQPPHYDIAFYLISNERIIWPLEAKVLKSDGAVGKYVEEINDNFITCRYAPFSSEGGMLGYLFSGDPDKVFINIAAKVPCTLSDHPDFPKRDHKTSDHQRVPSEKSYPAEFRCHHMLLKINSPVTNTAV
ncbi:hypothetical protein NIES4074_54590 [Cylindrospermum sp. NIES-4074]|nr:hypothetical protein NIES4074_54590 [Cylindrospermum sp. NIES-4074]